jgi:hypothetical protein
MLRTISLLVAALVIHVGAASAAGPEENDATAFFQRGKLVASVAGGTHLVDLGNDNERTVAFSSISTNARFAPATDIRWNGWTLRDCTDDDGKKLAAKTASIARWVCKLIREAPPPAPADRGRTGTPRPPGQ